MGLMDALFRKARRAVRAFRDQIFPPPEPEQLIAGRLDGMASTISRCKGQLTALLKEQRDLQLKVHRNANQITHHLREARYCTHRGEHELAAEHLRVKARHEQVASLLEKQLAEFRGQIERLADHVRQFEMVVEDTRRRKQLLLAQRECIQAHLLRGGPPGPGASTMGDLMESLETEVTAMETVAQITASAAGMPTAADRELSEELISRRVEDELGQLKRQIARTSPEPCLVPAADDEIVFIY